MTRWWIYLIHTCLYAPVVACAPSPETADAEPQDATDLDAPHDVADLDVPSGEGDLSHVFMEDPCYIDGEYCESYQPERLFERFNAACDYFYPEGNCSGGGCARKSEACAIGTVCVIGLPDAYEHYQLGREHAACLDKDFVCGRGRTCASGYVCRFGRRLVEHGYPIRGACDVYDARTRYHGECVTAPDCTDVPTRQVCGCDGLWYDNACALSAAGVPLDPSSERCPSLPLESGRCRTVSDCGPDEVCVESPLAGVLDCADRPRCEGDADCHASDETAVCDANRRCAAFGESRCWPRCASSDECADGLRCTDGRCSPKSCFSPRYVRDYCGPNEACQRDIGCVRRSCDSRTDCDDSFECVNGLCQPDAGICVTAP